MFQALVKYFVRGLLVIAPIGGTIYVGYIVFTAIDGWINVEPLLDRQVPGAGVVVTFVLIILTGVLASNVLTRWLFHATDRVIARLPVVKLLYTSIKDLIGAFVGEQRKFDNPVKFRPAAGNDLFLVGFLTRESLPEIGLADHAAVYVPMAYNVGGGVMIVPRDRLEPLPLDGATAMTFALSGGVSGGAAAPPLGTGRR